MKTKLIVTIFLLAFAIVFMIQNAAMVEIRLLLWQVAMPRSLLILMTLFIGIAIGWFIRAMYRISRAGQ